MCDEGTLTSGIPAFLKASITNCEQKKESFFFGAGMSLSTSSVMVTPKV